MKTEKRHYSKADMDTILAEHGLSVEDRTALLAIIDVYPFRILHDLADALKIIAEGVPK